jgi:SprT protein
MPSPKSWTDSLVAKRQIMPLFRQLQLELLSAKAILLEQPLHGSHRTAAVAGQALRLPTDGPANGAVALQLSTRRDFALESSADRLLRTRGAARIAAQIRVEWNPRLKSCAGRADYKAKLICLNPLLLEHGADEINRTFLHELAHILAQFRSGRRRIRPHGDEWRGACHDIGIGDEKRCHNLPFPVRQPARQFRYRCPNCKRDFPRVRRIKRTVACLPCCRAHNRGSFDQRFKLRLVNCSGGL